MSRRAAIVAVLLTGWALALAAGFAALYLIAPTGDGFTRGMNRLAAFAGWNALAAALAVAALLAGRGLAAGARLRRLSRLPALVLAAQAAALGLLIGWALLRG